MTSTYFELLEIKEKPSTFVSAEMRFHRACYMYIEGILDARADLDIPLTRETRRAIAKLHSAQRQHTIAMWKLGDSEYVSWVPWWRRLWHNG